MKVVFMGTPEFAASILASIHEKSAHEICAVVTVPDKPSGRGQKMHVSAVKLYAEKNQLQIFQPEKLRNEEFVSDLLALKADVFVVVAFRMLPQVIWKIPSKGTFNLHASLLPQYRGAAPINWAIINGEKESGVSTFLIDDKIDTGHIMLQKKVSISENETAGELHDDLMLLGSDLVLETLDRMAENNIDTIPQEDYEDLKLAPKLYKEDGKIDFSENIDKVHNKIRGLSPYPAAWINIEKNGEKKSFKILKGSIQSKNPGIYDSKIIVNNNQLLITLIDGVYALELVQLEGKKAMNSKDFINGLKGIESINIL